LLVENLRISQLLVDTQKATQDTVLRATAQLAAHDQKLRSAQDAVRALQRQLAVLRSDGNEPPAADAPKLPDAVAALPAIPDDVAALVTLAQQRRSELQGAVVQADAANAQAALVRQGRLPTVAVALDLGVQSSSYDASWDDKYAALSLVASWNIFDGGKREARATQAALARESAAFADAQTRAQIAADVRTVWDHARTARDAIATIDSRIVSERAAYELLNTRFAAGGVAQIEVLAAQTALISAQLERVLAVAELQQQMVELARVTEEAEQI
jgi:OMF family outer membrane factor